jgi:hypothetical protein
MTTTEDHHLPTRAAGRDRIEAYALGHVSLAGNSAEALTEMLQIICLELFELNLEVSELRTDNESLRASLAKEVRTERLAIVHPDDGRELVYTEVLGGSISLNVQFRDYKHAHQTSVALVSCDDNEGEAYVSLAAQEEIVAMVSATASSTDHTSSIAGDLMLQTETRRFHGEAVENFPRTEIVRLDTTGLGVEHAGGQVSTARFELQTPWRQ